MGGWRALEAWVEPAPMAVELQGRVRPVVRVRTSAAPAGASPDRLPVAGVVHDPGGRPIADASVWGPGLDVQTAADGTFSGTVEVEGDDLPQLFADKLGYEPVIRTEARLSDLRAVELVLFPHREVRVWCAGLPDDACRSVSLACFPARSPWATPDSDWCWQHSPGETTCGCPEGPAAIVGGGQVTAVPDGATDVWLDFRDRGTLTGRVLMDGEPALACMAVGELIASSLAEVRHIAVSSWRADCDADGRFTLRGLAPGNWVVSVNGGRGGEAARTRSPPAFRLAAGESRDLGDIELRAGGDIRGTVTDPLAGRSPYGMLVWAVKLSDSGPPLTPVTARVDEAGEFVIEGVPPGTWHVASPEAPHHFVTVEVEDGVESEVQLELSDDDVLRGNGFEVTMDDDGALVVAEVDPAGPAAAEGLRNGDRIVTVAIAGVPVEALGFAAAHMVLSDYDGPGLALVVDRDGLEHEVPLAW